MENLCSFRETLKNLDNCSYCSAPIVPRLTLSHNNHQVSAYILEEVLRENILLGDERIDREAAETLMEALVRPADVWILDEPTNHLDQNSAEFVRKCIAETGKTVITVTHDQALLFVCSRKIRL